MRPAAGPARRADAPLWALSYGHMMTHWYPGVFDILLVYIGQELNLSLVQVGFILSFRFWVRALTNVPSGMLVDLVGHKRLIMSGIMIWAGLPYALMGLFPTYGAILVCMGLLGLLNELWHPAAISTISEYYPGRRGFGLAMHSLGANAGDALAPLVAGLLLSVMHWRQVVTANLIPGVIAAFLLWRLFHRMQPGHTPDGAGERGAAGGLAAYRAGLAAIFKGNGFVAFMLLAATRALTQVGLRSFLPFYLARDLGYSAALVGAYMALMQTGGLVAAPISGRLSDRIGRRPIVTGGLFFSAIMLICVILLRVEWLFIAVLALLGFFFYSIQPVLQAWALDGAPREVGGTAVSLLFGSQAVTNSVGPLIGGWIADHYGLLYTFYFLAGTILIGNVLVWFIPRERRAV